MSTLVLKGGRVIDPEAGTDGEADVLLDGDQVASIAPGLMGDAELDVSGLIVGPGFIDLHSHVHSIAGQRLQALDGVTTSLDLEAGLMPIEKGYARAAAEGRPLHFGFSASWAVARGRILAGIEPSADVLGAFAVLAEPEWQRSSSKSELNAWLALLQHDLEAGGLGIGILLGYAPRTGTDELIAVARLAAEAGVGTFTHVRELAEVDPTTPADGPSEIVQVAAETGARMHHCHVNSSGSRHLDRVLATLAAGRAEGSPFTVEAYPYGAGSTGVGAYFLDPERLRFRGLSPRNIVLLPSGERIADEARLREVRERAPGTLCLIEHLDESNPDDAKLLQQAFVFPDSIVASDAMPLLWADGSNAGTAWPLPPGGSTHPRTAGTFSKTLRWLVREMGVWTWVEAFRRCSYLPARVLDFAPGARRKGRLSAGADADIVVLDPGSVSDAATYLDPTRPSMGVRHLFVAGTPVVRDGELVLDAYPGRPLRGEPR